MGQIGYFLMEVVALRWLKLQVVFVELVKHRMETLEVLRFHLQIHDAVIQVNDKVCQVEFCQAILHQLLEGCGCLA